MGTKLAVFSKEGSKMKQEFELYKLLGDFDEQQLIEIELGLRFNVDIS